MQEGMSSERETMTGKKQKKKGDAINTLQSDFTKK